MKRKKIFLVVGLASLSLAGVSTLVSGKVTGLFAGSPVCTHRGNHYLAKDATCVAAGNQEFWACCECETQFLQQPATGVWSEAKELTQTLESTHIAYVAPTGVHDFKPSTSVIGYYECEDCHEVGTQIMKTEDIVFSQNMYGANGLRLASVATDKDSVQSKRVVTGALAYSADTSKSVVLPRINYSLYSKVGVLFSIDHYKSDSLQVSLKIGDTVLASWAFLKADYHGYLFMEAVGSKLKVTVKIPGAAGASNTVEVDDADIVNGIKSLTISPVGTSGRTLYFNGIELSEKFVTQIDTNGLSKGTDTSAVYTTFDTYTGTVGGVTGTFIRAVLPASDTGTFALIQLMFNNVKYSASTANIGVKFYIDCESTTETSSAMIFQDYNRTGWSQDNPNWCIANVSTAHNAWKTITIASTRLQDGSGNLNRLHMYANGAKAARTYYIQFVELSGDASTSMKFVQNVSIYDVKTNTVATSGSNYGSHVSEAVYSAPEDNHGYDGYATKFTLAYASYTFDRIEFVRPMQIAASTNLKLRVYIEASETATSDYRFGLSPDLSGAAGTLFATVAKGSANTWVDIVFNNIQTIANNGLLDHINLAFYNGGFVAGQVILVSMLSVY